MFGKSARFDSSSDSLVRVKAREVRKRLSEYYESTPDAPLRIELPVGSYVPLIRATETASADDLPEIELSLTPDEGAGLERAPEEVQKTAPKFIILLITVLIIALTAVI